MVLHHLIYSGSNRWLSVSYGWLRRMIKQNNLSFCWVSSVGKRVPVDAPECCNGNEKLSFSIMLTAGVCKVDNQPEAIPFQLIIIFKSLTKTPKNIFPTGRWLKAQRETSWKEALLSLVKVQNCWKKDWGVFSSWSNYF